MKEANEFRKKVGLSNVYFSEEMEHALCSYGFKTEIVPLYYGEKIIGIVTNYTKKYKISLPPYLFPFYGFYIENDFLTKHPEKAIDILRSATENQKKKFIYSLFSLPPEITDIRSFKESGWRESVKYTYRIYGGEPILKSSKNRKLRRINESEYTIKESNGTAELYEMIVNMNGSKRRSTPYTGKYLNLIFNNLQPSRRIIYGIYDGKGLCLASAFILRDKSCSYLFANAIHSKIRKSNLNLYFLNQIIQKELEISPCFDLQGANTPSIVKFKENFNTHLIQYFHIKTGLDITGLIKLKGMLKRWSIH
ncbi:MAG: hypothetical protein GWP03_00935 [Proteobacteria bacterium]|nr:hypothetical protein [Pseudomonadota bacterium]